MTIEGLTEDARLDRSDMLLRRLSDVIGTFVEEADLAPEEKERLTCIQKKAMAATASGDKEKIIKFPARMS
ncbi:hypothetical protein J7426_12475 [Tropicibacter sp. R16_0]|uniref:hypothetical protein n=1 Tax=Tropicibacter sp. R16_0 TaxID=2821102 RepID=UPI001ADD27B7|nr:hypothetical protein [Tropicibacter sp. R16_0]MBO9451080.1 hypothetical protein [Tropicibacter sp. R16_0]